MNNYDNNDQLNIPRMAALLNNNKGIQHNFYSRAQITLDKRAEKQKSSLFSEAVNTIHSTLEPTESTYDHANTLHIPAVLLPRKPSLSSLLNKNSKSRASPPKRKVTPEKQKSNNLLCDPMEIRLTGTGHRAQQNTPLFNVNVSQGTEVMETQRDRIESKDLHLSTVGEFSVDYQTFLENNTDAFKNTTTNASSLFADPLNNIIDIANANILDVNQDNKDKNTSFPSIIGSNTPSFKDKTQRPKSQASRLKKELTTQLKDLSIQGQGHTQSTQNTHGSVQQSHQQPQLNKEFEHIATSQLPSPRIDLIPSAIPPTVNMHSSLINQVIVTTPRAHVIVSDDMSYSSSSAWGGISLSAHHSPNAYLASGDQTPVRQPYQMTADGSSPPRDLNADMSIFSLGSQSNMKQLFKGPEMVGGGFRPTSPGLTRPAPVYTNYTLPIEEVPSATPTPRNMHTDTTNSNSNGGGGSGKHDKLQGGQSAPTTAKQGVSYPSPRLQSTVSFRNHTNFNDTPNKNTNTTQYNRPSSATTKTSNQDLSKFIFTPDTVDMTLPKEVVQTIIKEQQQRERIQSVGMHNIPVTIYTPPPTTHEKLKRPKTANAVLFNDTNITTKPTLKTFTQQQTQQTSQTAIKAPKSNISEITELLPVEQYQTMQHQLARYKEIISMQQNNTTGGVVKDDVFVVNTMPPTGGQQSSEEIPTDTIPAEPQQLAQDMSGVVTADTKCNWKMFVSPLKQPDEAVYESKQDMWRHNYTRRASVPQDTAELNNTPRKGTSTQRQSPKSSPTVDHAALSSAGKSRLLHWTEQCLKDNNTANNDEDDDMAFLNMSVSNEMLPPEYQSSSNVVFCTNINENSLYANGNSSHFAEYPNNLLEIQGSPLSPPHISNLDVRPYSRNNSPSKQRHAEHLGDFVRNAFFEETPINTPKTRENQVIKSSFVVEIVENNGDVVKESRDFVSLNLGIKSFRITEQTSRLNAQHVSNRAQSPLPTLPSPVVPMLTFDDYIWNMGAFDPDSARGLDLGSNNRREKGDYNNSARSTRSRNNTGGSTRERDVAVTLNMNSTQVKMSPRPPSAAPTAPSGNVRASTAIGVRKTISMTTANNRAAKKQSERSNILSANNNNHANNKNMYIRPNILLDTVQQQTHTQQAGYFKT